MRHRTISRVDFATLVNLATLVNSATLNYSLPLALLVLGSLGLQPAAAQIIPDSTLPNNSVVPAGCTNCTITGGTRPTGGNNLFHSFSSFSVPTGGSANFDNGLDIQNIFTRVTGGNISNIDGTIRAQGSANLFLLNPNGIVFGPNARINIGGSFVGSTANSIRFSDFEFTAVNPNDQASLLTVNVPLGLQFGNNPGSIAMRGTDATNTRITMAANQSFILAGNNLEIDNGRVTVPGGHIELASIAGTGQVSLTDNAPFSPFRLTIPTNIARGNINTINTSRFATAATRGGSMSFTAQRINLLGDNLTQGGVQGVGADVPSGDINFDVRDALNMDYAVVTNNVNPGFVGNAGNINIIAGSLSMVNGAQFSTVTAGTGNAGNITITANSLSLNGALTDVTVLPTRLTGEPASQRNMTGFSTTTMNRGQGGNISVTGDRLTIAEGAVIRTGTLGSGNSGDLSVNVNRVNISSENILRSAPDPSGRPRQGGGISTAVLSPQATGRGGNVSIVSDRLDISNYGQISTSTLGAGNAGSVLIRADVVNMQGVDSRRTSQSAATTSISTFSGRGAGGSGGDITIISDRLFAREGSAVIAGTASIGNAGNVTVRAREIELEGTDYTRSISGLLSTAVTGSTGQGGNVTITGDRLRVLNGALIATGTFTSGNAGNIRVNVDDVEVSGSSPVSGISGLRSSVEVATATGQGGDIFIESDRLRLLDGGQVTSSTLGQGSAGNIAVNARSIELSGIAEDMPTLGDRPENTVRFVRNSNISAAAVSPTGNSANVSGSAGSVTVNAETLRVSNGAALTVSSLGSGNAGNLTIRANSVQLENGGLLQAEANAGNQGNIRITAPAISLSDRSRISTNAQGTATGGNISINTRYLIANGNSDITANSVSSFGGRVQVTADGILGAEFRPQLTPDNDITASSERGAEFSGTVTLQTPNVNPGQGATELPETVVDSSTQVAAACSGSTDNTFVATGRGGVPPTPEQALLGQNIWTDLRSIGVTSEASSQLEASPDQQSNQSEASPTLMEAQGWRMTPEGKVELVADATEVMTPTHCIAQ
jgi:filamentous hemagglutinin family protein